MEESGENARYDSLLFHTLVMHFLLKIFLKIADNSQKKFKRNKINN